MRPAETGARVYRYGASRMLPYFMQALGVMVVLAIAATERVSWSEPVLLLFCAVMLLSVGYGVWSDLRSPREFVIDEDTLTIRWRRRDVVVDLSDLSFAVERVMGYPPERIRLQYGEMSVIIESNLVAYEDLMKRLALRTGNRLDGTVQKR